jgi:transcriptional regulator with XRE-family HTH domain
MNDVDAPKATTPEGAATPWADLLSSAKLKAAGLKMEALAEQVGVSAAYLRLLRQGKRSASTETAVRLLTHLGLHVETKPKDDGADVVADDGKGNVVVVSTKTAKAGRPSSLEQTLEEILHTTKDLQERVPPKVYVSAAQADSEKVAAVYEWLSRSLHAFEGAWEAEAPAEAPPAEAQDRPSRRAPYAWKHRGGWPVGSVPGPIVGLGMAVAGSVGSSSIRAQAERLLRAVPDDDLPLAASYLALLVDLSSTRSSRGSGGTTSESRGMRRDQS